MGIHQSPHDQLLRLHKELLFTIGGTTFLSKAELARRTNISVHTVKRRIDELRKRVGEDHVLYSRATGGYYYPEKVPAPVECPLTRDEQIALSLLSEVVTAFRNTPFDAAMRNALDQIKGILPDIPTVLTQDGPMFFCLPQAPIVDDPLVSIHFKPILQAIEEHRQISFQYYDWHRRQTSKCLVDPYHLFCGQGNWYLYGYCHESRRTADYALQRIRGDIHLLNTHFQSPEPEAVIRKLRQRFGLIEGELLNVAVRFLPERAEWVRERQWHDSQRFEDQPDGSTIMHLRCEGLQTLVRWVVGFGGEAIPIAPSSLVDGVRKFAEKVIESCPSQSKTGVR